MWKTLLCIAFFTMVMGGLVLAQTAAGYPDAYAMRPLELPTGMVQLKVPVIVNLSKD